MYDSFCPQICKLVGCLPFVRSGGKIQTQSRLFLMLHNSDQILWAVYYVYGQYISFRSRTRIKTWAKRFACPSAPGKTVSRKMEGGPIWESSQSLISTVFEGQIGLLIFTTQIVGILTTVYCYNSRYSSFLGPNSIRYYVVFSLVINVILPELEGSLYLTFHTMDYF